MVDSNWELYNSDAFYKVKNIEKERLNNFVESSVKTVMVDPQKKYEFVRSYVAGNTVGVLDALSKDLSENLDDEYVSKMVECYIKRCSFLDDESGLSVKCNRRDYDNIIRVEETHDVNVHVYGWVHLNGPLFGEDEHPPFLSIA
ncbi:MAG: hypothetical protein ACRC0G_07135 [Fusobacteriaceae bacterium]